MQMPGHAYLHGLTPYICSHLASLLQGVLADVSIATGWMTIGLMVTGRFVFQYLGWGFAAAATPAVMLLSGAAFFGFSLASQFPSWNLSLGGMNLAAAGATAGAVTQVWGCGSYWCLLGVTGVCPSLSAMQRSPPVLPPCPVHAVLHAACQY